MLCIVGHCWQLFNKLREGFEKNTIFREDATSTLAGFHTDLLSWSDWKLEVLVLFRWRKTGKPGENSGSEAGTSNKPNARMTPSWNRTQATLVVGERSHHCAIQAPPFVWPKFTVFAREERRSHRYKYWLYDFRFIKVKHCEFWLTVGKPIPLDIVVLVRFCGTTFGTL